MKSWSVKAGKFFGIEVFIHWTFWILIGWIFLLHYRTEQSFIQGLWAALFILALFLCVVLHEFGHALSAKRFGVVTKDITLYPIGGIASFVSMPEKPVHELLVGLAGPAVNLVIAVILWSYLKISGQMPDPANFGDFLALVPATFLFNLLIANITLAVFNLIPAFPMDGGRVFRAFLSFFTDKQRATRIATGIGQFLAIIFVFLGFFYNFWLVFIGLFIFLGAGGEAAFEQMKSALSGLTVKDAVMQRFTVLNPFDSLGDAAEALLNSQETEFVIADNERAVGLLTRNDIIKGLSEQEKEAQVSAFMNPDLFVVNSAMSLPDFFQEVLNQGQSVAIVMDGNSLVGLIDRENVEEKIMIREILRRRENH